MDLHRSEVALQIQQPDFASLVENAKVDELVKMLSNLREAQLTAGTKAKLLSIIQKQQLIVDKLIGKSLSDKDRRLVILASLKNSASLFWIDQIETGGKANLRLPLREVAEKHVDDSDKEIALESRIQLAKLNSLDASQHAAVFGKELHQLLADYPDNARVRKTITTSLNYLVVKAEDRPATEKVLNQFFELPKVTGDLETERLYDLLRDLKSLCELNFFDAAEQVDSAGQAGRDKLRDVCLELAKVPTAGMEVIGNLIMSAKVLESSDHYKHAGEIYAAVLESADRLKNPAAAKIRELGKWGVTRCGAVGKPFNLVANLHDGKPLERSAVKSKPVLVILWSRSDDFQSIFAEVDKASQQWPKQSVKIVAVQVEQGPASFDFDQDNTRELIEKFPTWSFCHEDAAGTRPIFSQIPRRSFGKVALLDKNLSLRDVDVNIEELATAVNKILALHPKKH